MDGVIVVGGWLGGVRAVLRLGESEVDGGWGVEGQEVTGPTGGEQREWEQGRTAAGLMGQVGQSGEVISGRWGFGRGVEVRMDDGVGENGAAGRVEHDVRRGDPAVGETGAMEVVEGFCKRAEERDQFAGGQGATAAEKAGESAGHDVLAEQEPLGFGLAELQEAREMRMGDALQDEELFTKLLRV